MAKRAAFIWATVTEAEMQHFRVGDFLVRPDLNEIEGPQGTRHVEPKVMEVLVCLASRPGRVTTRDRLMDAVWTDVNVGEKVLTRAVSELRRAFSDDPRDPAVIETIPKRGYRLMAEVLQAGAARTGRVVPTGETPGPSRRTWSPAAPAGLALAGLTLGLLALGVLVTAPSLVPSRPADARAWSGTPRPVSAMPGLESDSALSPEAGQVAYMARAADGSGTRLHLWDSRSQDSRQISHGPGFDRSPLFTPDGRALVFLRFTQQGCRIMQVGLDSGQEEELRACPQGLQPGMAWAPQGNDLIGASGEDCKSGSRLVRIPLLSGEPQALTYPPKGWVGDSHPVVSEDGSILFRRAQDPFSHDLWIKPVDGKERRFSQLSATILGHSIVPDGSVVLSTESGGPGYQIRRLSAHGEEMGPIRLPGWNLKYPQVSAQGHLLYEEWEYDTNLWSIPLDEEQGEPTQVAPSTYWDWHGAYSPDGHKVAYVSNRGGSFQVWTAWADGREARFQTRLEEYSAAHPAWAPDGGSLVFEARREGRSGIYSIPYHGGLARQLVSDSWEGRWPAFSADGKWVFFASSHTGRSEIWKVSSQGGEPHQVTRKGGHRALASSDGRWLFFSNSEGLFRQQAEGGGTHKVAGIPQGMLHGGWTLTPEALYLLRFDAPSAILLRRPLESLAQSPVDSGSDDPWQEVASLERLYFGPLQAISVAPGDASLLFVRVDRAESNVILAPPPSEQ